MHPSTAKALTWILGGCASVLFILQGIAWALLRRKQIKVETWKTYAQRWRLSGLVLLVVGAGLWFLTQPEGKGPASVATIGGSLNAFVASFHLRVIAWFSKPRR